MTWWGLVVAVAVAAGEGEAPLEDAATHVRGHLGVGSFGSTAFSTLATPFTPSTTTVVPLLGARYWFPPAAGPLKAFGLELAAGLNVVNNRTDLGQGISNSSSVAFAVHAAIPVALLSTRYFLAHLAPEFRHVSYAVPDSSTSQPLVDPTVPTRTTGTSSTDGALRAGGELFFGFIGVPSLSLEVSLRVGVRSSESRQVFGPQVALASSVTVLTPAPQDLLQLFTSSFALKYYF
ncbi:MAG: hypothetical protein ACOZQL_19820 [Myxococcota bacterium]